jgi:hypothetical protein
MTDKHKDPGQILIDLRMKFREAAAVGVLGGEQKALFELTLISILNEAEEQRQKCLKLKHQYERDAERAEAQAISFNMIQNVVYNVFGNILDKVNKSNQEEKELVEEKEKLENELTKEEVLELEKINKKQESVRIKKTRVKK